MPHSGLLSKSLLAMVLFAGSGAALANDAVPVVIANVGEGGIEQRIELTGTVTAERRSSLSARTAGLVSVVNVDEGSRVEKGDVILELDAALATLALERAQEAVKEARTRLTESRRLFEEGKKLAETGGLPRTEAEARLATYRAQAAAVKQLEVNLKERTEVVDRHRLIAPFSGVISDKMTEVGEWVETGVPVLELVDVDHVRFDAQAPQERYAQLSSDTPVTVRFDSDPHTDFPAKLRTKVPVKDPVARTFLVRLDVDAPEDVMAPGVSGSAVFEVGGDRNSLTVPRDAVVRQADGSTNVWVVADSDGMLIAKPRVVKVGSGMGDSVEVLEGLEAGQRVIVRGNETLRDGQAVRLLPNS